jgi:photosystem II stability/assembly factor-like uncharacterized protein
MKFKAITTMVLLWAGQVAMMPAEGQKMGRESGQAEKSIPAAKPMGTSETYANGEIRGFWKFNHFTDDETGTYGHKTVDAAYDSLSNTVYILSDHRNVLTGPLKDSAALAMTNQKVVINGNLFLGVVTRKNNFRLLGAIQPEWNNGSIYYSDNGGQSWERSKGGDLSDREVRWSAIMEDPGRTVLILTVQPVYRANSKIELYTLLESTDQGESFSPVSNWEEKDPVTIVACKPYNTDTCYFIRKLTQSNVWSVRIFDYAKHEFIPVAMHYSKKVPASFVGTRDHDTTYLYVGAKGGGYVSKDGGKTWTSRQIRERIASVDPVHPELLVESAATGFVSKDGGKKWEHLPWWEKVFGWDLHSVKWFRTRDTGWVAVLDNDFGAHFTTDYTDSLAWKHLNTDNIHMILHHGAYDDGTGLLITANQDRGTMIWEKARDGYYKGNTVTKADGLRVTIADRGNSYWYIHYWNTVYHKLYRKGQREKVDSLVVDIPRVLKDTTWYTPPMQPSWKPGEDVIFIAGNNRLIRLEYDPYYNSISRMELPFNFRDSTDEVLAGLATCRANPDRMYACSKNGKFYLSDDLGKTWEKTAYSGPVPFVRNRPWWGPYGYCIETAPDDASFVCWAGDGESTNAFLISEDGGKTFTAATDGLPEASNIRDMAITPGGKYIFANNGYVYSRKDHKWFDMTGGSCPDSGEINSVEYLPKEKIVRYFTYGVGVLDFVLTE